MEDHIARQDKNVLLIQYETQIRKQIGKQTILKVSKNKDDSRSLRESQSNIFVNVIKEDLRNESPKAIMRSLSLFLSPHV